MVAFLNEKYPYVIAPTPVYSYGGLSYLNFTNIPVESKVKAGKLINENVSTQIVDTRDFGLENPTNITHVYVVEKERTLTSMDLVPNSVWIKMLNIANDQRSVNVELEATQTGIVLTTTRPIYAGEPLLMWFGKKLRTILNIPYINGSNIYNMDYKCHICQKLFNWPNPLLIHITLKCDTITVSSLWKSLATEMHVYAGYSNFGIDSILSPGKINPYSLYSEYNSSQPIDMNAPYNYLKYDPVIMENEASNNGKTADGNYQCRICLKKYSRKHGLKIHFRIHTGYKPLKCKYCDRAFGDPSNLNKHVRLHSSSETSKYKCDTCNQSVMKRRDLESHMHKSHPELLNSRNLTDYNENSMKTDVSF